MMDTARLGDALRSLGLLPYGILQPTDPAGQWGRVTRRKKLIDVPQTREAKAPKTPGKIRRSWVVRFSSHTRRPALRGGLISHVI